MTLLRAVSVLGTHHERVKEKNTSKEERGSSDPLTKNELLVALSYASSCR